MQIITLPKKAIYMLHTLSKSVSVMTGYRCRLSRSKELVHLLRLASLAKNQNISAQFLQFLSQLDKEQLKSLLRSGIKMPLEFIKKVKPPFWTSVSNTIDKNIKATITNIQDKFIGNLLLAS